jgi:imidazole glycerol-phosphate synthase subunit HisF
MIYKRIIPVLLIQDGGLVKGTKFKDYKYVGDPINAVKIFNDKEVDEICILDISATKSGKGPDLNLIKEIASEAFMPLSYGGGISSLDQVESIIRQGVEKVIFNSTVVNNYQLVTETAMRIGSSSTVVCIDIKKKFLGGYSVFVQNGTKDLSVSPADYAQKMQDLGAGEIILNNIDKDGTLSGFDLDIISKVSKNVTIPVITAGGCATVEHIKEALKSGADAIAAGAMFVFHGKHRAVLISYLNREEIIDINRI